MSNLNTHGVYSFETAKRFLGGKSQRTLCFATILQAQASGSSDVEMIAVRHHSTDIIRYYSDGRIEIRNHGYLTATTTDRLHRMTPMDVRVSRARGGHVESPAYVGAQPYDWTTVTA